MGLFYQSIRIPKEIDMTALYEVHGDVAVITLNNPPVNGLGLLPVVIIFIIRMMTIPQCHLEISYYAVNIIYLFAGGIVHMVLRHLVQKHGSVYMTQ